MGNKYSCGHGTSEYTTELLDCVRIVENTSETLAKSLDCHIPLVKKLLNNRVTGVQDRSGPSHSCQQFHYHHLEKLDDEKHAVRESVAELLRAVQKKYILRDKLTKEQQHMKISESKSDTFENSEFNDLEKYITGLERDNKRLLEKNQTLINENDTFKRKLEQEREDNILFRKTLKDTDEDTRLFQKNVGESAKNEEKTAFERKQNIHVLFNSVVASTTKNDNSLFQDNKKPQSVKTEGKLTQIPFKQTILENAMDKSEIISILKCVKEYELGRTLATLDNEVQEKLIENLTVGVRRLIDENRSLKESNRKMIATKASAMVKLEKPITDLKQEAEQLRMKANLFEDKTDTLKTQNGARITELNETTNELAAVCKSKAEIERALMSKTQDYQNLQLEKESNASARVKLEKQITDLKQEVEQLRIKVNLFEEQTDTLKTQNNASVAKLNETTNELAAVRKSKTEIERALMSKTQDYQNLKLENESNTATKVKLEIQITDLKREVEQLRIKANLFEGQTDTLKSENNACVAKLNGTTNELAAVRESKAEMERALMSKTQDYQNLQLEKESNSKKMATQKSAMVKLEKQITDLKQEAEQLRIKAKLFEEQTEKLKTQNNASIAELNETTNELAEVRKSKAEMERVLMSKTLDYDNLQLEYESLKQDIEKFKRTKVMHVQLYHHNRMSLISEIENDLKALLKIEMEDAMTKLDFVACDKVCDIDLNNPVLILCVCVSRLGTDATNAIQALKLTSKMALVIFHHKEEHALPKQASVRLLTGQMFMRLGGVLDLAFLQSKGIYNCEMNIKNIKSLVDFLNKESVKSAE